MRVATAKLTTALLGAALASLLLAAAAAAEPKLGIELNRGTAPGDVPVTHADERAVYQVIVRNEASSSPEPGTEVECVSSAAKWTNVDSDANLSFQWLRGGEEIPGATEATYTPVAADEGEALQCRVTAENPQASKVEAATAGRVATVTAGSNVATGVFTATGTGTLSAGSTTVTGVEPSPPVGLLGAFAVGQTIVAEGIPAETTIAAVGAGTLELSAPATESGSRDLGAGAQPFEVGQEIRGSGTFSKESNAIPPGTTITAIDGTSITMSSAATLSSSALQIQAISPTAARSVAVSLPAPAVTPVPLPPPPNPTDDPRKTESRPRVVNAEGGTPIDGETRFCEAPSNWSAEASFEYRWLRNGEEIPSETSEEYVPSEAEDKFAVLQCEVIATSGSGEAPGGGTVVSVSAVSSWSVTTNLAPFREGFRPLVAPPLNSSSNLPSLSFTNTTAGPITVAIELPGGLQTRVLRVSGSGWSCAKQPPTLSANASATCTREEALLPETSYPAIILVERPGADAPDALITKATASGGGASEAASAEDVIAVGPGPGFGFAEFIVEVLDELGGEYTQAGGHPFSAGATLKFNEHVRAEVFPVGSTLRAVNGSAKVIRTDTPRGFVGNAQATPELCQTMALVTMKPTGCPEGSAVGGITIETSEATFVDEPVYAIEPEFGTPAQFAFGISSLNLAYSLTPELRASDGYAISLLSSPAPKTPELFAVDVLLCGFGAQPLGISPVTGESQFEGCRKAGEAGANPVPLLTNPTRCSGPAPTTRILADSWEAPGDFKQASFTSPALSGCDEVPFEPTIEFTPTSRAAGSPTGLDVELRMPTAGLEDPDGIAQANLHSSTVTLPAAMSVNPSLANGLGACSVAEIGLGDNDPPRCPPASKIGSAEVQTPLLGDPLQGSVYVARQGANPFGSLLALYLVFESARDGITIKIAGRVSPDPVTGQLTASFTENPEAPFSRLALKFNGGPRAPLINPPLCGNYAIAATLSPWSAADPANPSAAEAVTSSSVYQVISGPGGSGCPRGQLAAGLQAGLLNPTAGASSPFVLRLARNDATQRFSALDVQMPPGLSGYLRGIPYCPEGALAAVSGALGSAAGQLAAPSCPAASQIGTVTVASGAGPAPFYLSTGRAYLAGPYKGAPLSLAIVTPALAGPFDLGSVVVRSALRVDPETARISAASDPIPTILHGIVLDVREIRVNLDRPGFMLAPTNCEPMAIAAGVHGERGGFAALTERFQVGGCGRLAFKPRIALRLLGGIGRGAYQGLRAVVRPRPGEANISRTAVRMPRSAFLAQEHIRTVCTRVQFAAEACPKGSVYGRALAYSPLLDYPLRGNVYLRSSDNQLPDLVADLRGPAHQPLRIELVGRTDSVKGALRSTFDVVPDAPVSYFRLQLFGKRKGLIVNSRNVCVGKNRAAVRMDAHSGHRALLRPRLHNKRCKAFHRKRRKARALKRKLRRGHGRKQRAR